MDVRQFPWEKSIRDMPGAFQWRDMRTLLQQTPRKKNDNVTLWLSGSSFPTSHTRYVKIANYSLLCRPRSSVGIYVCVSSPLLLLSLHRPLSFLVFLSSSYIHRSFLALFVSLVPFCPDGRNSDRELVPSSPVGTWNSHMIVSCYPTFIYTSRFKIIKLLVAFDICIDTDKLLKNTQKRNKII